MTTLKTKITGAIIIGILAFLFLALATRADADGKPAQVLETEVAIANNQIRIAEIRQYVEEFETLKRDNARLVGRLEVFNYNYDWSLNTAVKASLK